MKITYKIILDDHTKRRVQGFQITEHFAAHCEKRGGWAVTHLPTGRALVLSRFSDFEEAKAFAQGYEVIFGGSLDQKEVNYKKRETEKATLARVAACLNALPETYTMNEIKLKFL